MASTDARPVPRRNTAFRVYFPILDADGDPVSGAAGLDSEVSIDGAAFADCTNEATEIGTSGLYFLDLTSGEMNGDAVIIRVQTSTSGAKTTPIIMYPEEAGDIRCDLITDAVNSTSVAASGANEIRDAILDDATRFSGARIDATVSSRATPAQVNAEVVDGLNVDTYGEPASAPAATSSLVDKIRWLFTLARNEIRQNSTTQTLRNDANSANLSSASVSDDGTTFTRGEWS